MIIDFHTHIFPDSIAERSMDFLQKQGNVRAATDGTLSGLKKSMKDNHIDISVVLPVMTRPSQFDTINRFAAEINGKDGIISFGGVHPDTDDYIDNLNTVKSLGLSGIKLHPDYQETYVDDEKMVRIIRYASELGLIVSLHAGIDIGLPDTVYCPPRRAANMLKQIDEPNARIVLAHMGGYKQWDEVEEYLVGRNVWFDTGYCVNKIPAGQLGRIIKNHGADKILFASDCPWEGQQESYEFISKLKLSEDERDCIFFRNALNLLGI